MLGQSPFQQCTTQAMYYNQNPIAKRHPERVQRNFRTTKFRFKKVSFSIYGAWLVILK